jgi:hypothetical protein
MRILLIGLFSLSTMVGYAQSATPMKVPATAISRLEDLKELTKKAAVNSGKVNAKAHAEVRPDLNRYLVISADEFVRITASEPSKEAYLKSIEMGLARLEPLATTAEDRQQVAEYFQELMEIVGLESSEGRLAAFVGKPKRR